MKTIHPHILAVLLTGFLFSAPAAPTQKMTPKSEPPLISLHGKLVRYLIDPFGEVDGLFLDNGTLVKVPPHMSADVAELVKPGDPLALQGAREGQSGLDAYSITNTASDQTLLRRKPAWNGKVMPRELRVAELRQLSANGKIERIITGKRGEPRIILLADGTNVRLPKDATYDASSASKPASRFPPRAPAPKPDMAVRLRHPPLAPAPHRSNRCPVLSCLRVDLHSALEQSTYRRPGVGTAKLARKQQTSLEK